MCVQGLYSISRAKTTTLNIIKNHEALVKGRKETSSNIFPINMIVKLPLVSFISLTVRLGGSA